MGRKPHPAPRGFLSRVGTNRLKFTSDCPTLIINLVSYSLQTTWFFISSIVSICRCEFCTQCTITEVLAQKQTPWPFHGIFHSTLLFYFQIIHQPIFPRSLWKDAVFDITHCFACISVSSVANPQKWKSLHKSGPHGHFMVHIQLNSHKAQIFSLQENS